MRSPLGICFFGLLLAVAACGATSDGKARSGEQPAAQVTPAACEQHRPSVRALYAADARTTAPDHADKSAPTELSDQQVADSVADSVADNVAMIMGDCHKQPARLVPCLAAAISVAQLERDCVIPLDDEGAVEGEYFRTRRDG